MVRHLHIVGGVGSSVDTLHARSFAPVDVHAMPSVEVHIMTVLFCGGLCVCRPVGTVVSDAASIFVASLSMPQQQQHTCRLEHCMHSNYATMLMDTEVVERLLQKA
jgi:hypothetical protein